MKVSLHFLMWLTAAAAAVCSWVVCAVDMGTPVAFLTLLLTLGCGLWGFIAFSPRGTVRNAYCSFCRKNYREVGPVIKERVTTEDWIAFIWERKADSETR